MIAGRYESDTGLIIRVEDNAAVLFSDLTMHEVRLTKYKLQFSKAPVGGGLVHIIRHIDTLTVIEESNLHSLYCHQLKAKPDDLQLCSDVSSGVDSLGQHQWGDLVNLE